MKIVLILFASLFFTYSVLACRCTELKELTQQELNQATDIFIGKVMAVDTLVNSQKISVLISLKESIKGNKQNEKVVSTEISGAACGLSLKVGQEWFFFITEYNGDLRVNMCGRHLNVTKPRFRLCKKKRGLNALTKERYKENLHKVDQYKEFISARREDV